MTTLDELRRANLQEQRRSAQTPPTAPAAPQSVAAPAPTEAPAPATVEAKPVPQAAPPVPADRALDGKPHTHENGHVASKPSTPAVQTADASVDETDPYTRKARAVMDRFYRGLARKVVHPTGVKATVDMPPELFWRVKRYCHDHNNATVRQLFLDLVIALLDEEGY